eukprot:5833974-Lingulodinium_polyedra.AAC.1
MVGSDIWTWCHDGRDADLTDLSREPFTTSVWRKARESREAKTASEGSSVALFSKLNLVPLVLSKHLHAKTQFLAYDHDQGPPAAQHLVSKQQRRLAAFIDDAQEWADTKVEAMVGTMTE